jgi:hypothetical protein
MFHLCKDTYKDRELLSQPRRDKAEHKSTDRDACPETCGYHTRLKVTTTSLTAHEGNDPASKSNLSANITKKKDRGDPGDTTVKSFFEATLGASLTARIRVPVLLT